MNDKQLLRYSRQIMLPQFDVKGQEVLLSSSALIVGLGGLGSPVALYLASAGVGKLTLIDHDEVDLSNLQRQIIHQDKNIGLSKVSSAANAIEAINPDVSVTCVQEKLQGEALDEQVDKADIVLDCTDNFAVRFALNRACVKFKVPLVSGAAIRMEGQVSVFDNRIPNSPCYQCLHNEANDEDLNCSNNGVLAPIVGIIGSIQATEAIKVLSNIGKPLLGRLLLFDAQTMEFRELFIKRNENCTVCG